MLQVGVKGQPPVLDGELHDQVKPDDCFWNISDGKLIEITLQKVWCHRLHISAAKKDHTSGTAYAKTSPELGVTGEHHGLVEIYHQKRG